MRCITEQHLHSSDRRHIQSDLLFVQVEVYKENRIGPRTEPWGTPQYRVSAEKVPLQGWPRDNQPLGLLIRILQSTVSKAALRSNCTKAEHSPALQCIKISFETLECHRRKQPLFLVVAKWLRRLTHGRKKVLIFYSHPTLWETIKLPKVH